MNFRAGDRVHVLRLNGMKVDFTATLKSHDVLKNSYAVENCSDKAWNGVLIFKETYHLFGSKDYYEHVTDDSMTVRQFEQSNPDVISINRFINLAEQQRLKGLEKYRTSLEDANLPVDELITHLEEELVDAWVYLQEIKRQTRR